eukprot:gene29995-18068_t
MRNKIVANNLSIKGNGATGTKQADVSNASENMLLSSSPLLMSVMTEPRRLTFSIDAMGSSFTVTYIATITNTSIIIRYMTISGMDENRESVLR